MSITKETTVWCDDCGNWEQSSQKARRFRRELRLRGWRYVDKRDLCPVCAKKETPAT